MAGHDRQYHRPIERCEISGVEAFLIAAQLRWAGHVIRMDDHRIPKRVFYSQLAHGSRTSGGQMKRYKDTLKVNLKACDIPTADLESCPGQGLLAHYMS